MVIVLLSIVIWWAIDQIKRLYPVFKVPETAGKVVTVCLAIIAGGLMAWGYHLDLFVALGLFDEPSVGGMVFAGIAMAAGASAIYELVEKVHKVTVKEG